MSLSPQQDRSVQLDRALDQYLACRPGDVQDQDAALREVVRVSPVQEWAWFDLGLHAKWRRDWTSTHRYNERALSVATELRGNPAAWNLGIAATALGDWTTARRAWAAYGVPLPPGEGPIAADFGPTPVRLNPDPRFPGQLPLVLSARRHRPEIVWCRRLCPARAVITNVPFPESGHRFGDVILHDGEPVGRRTVAGRDYPVFEEIERLTTSPLPTLGVRVRCPGEQDAVTLVEAFRSAELAAEDWTPAEASCRACARGRAGQDHRHDTDGPWAPDRSFGVAAPEYTAAQVLAAWRAGGRGRGHDVPELLV